MHAWGRVALLLGLTGISGAACAAPTAPTASTPLDVSYRQVGVSDGVVVLVERRPERGREWAEPERRPRFPGRRPRFPGRRPAPRGM